MTRLFRHLSGAALAMMLTAPAAFAQTPSPAMQQAILAGLNAETRTEIERRATGGNTVYEVLRVTLLNNMQLANLIQGRDSDTFCRSVDLLVSRLRQRLREDAREPRYIKTVRNEGYVFAEPVEVRT